MPIQPDSMYLGIVIGSRYTLATSLNTQNGEYSTETQLDYILTITVHYAA